MRYITTNLSFSSTSSQHSNSQRNQTNSVFPYLSSSMNYLAFLPEEVWRAIFVMIPAPWIYGADISSDPLLLFRSHQINYEEMKDTQSERLSLLLICKAMRPIAEELLYSEVCLTSLFVAEKFTTAATMAPHCDGRRSPGWWTRRLILDTREWTVSPFELANILKAINSACPNLACVHMEQGSWGLGRTTRGVRLLRARGLRTLTVTGTDLKAENLTEIARRYPNLVHLHVYPSTAMYGRLQSMQFPHLRRLSLSSHVVHEMANACVAISLPNLEWLSIRITRASVVPALHAFCSQHGSALAGLELYVDVGKSTSRPVILPSRFFDFGAHLKTLVLSPSIALEFSETTAPLEGLTEVQIRVDVFQSMFTAYDFAQYFGPSRFPNMRRIIIVLNTFSLYDGPEICNSIRKYLLDVSIEMRTDYV